MHNRKRPREIITIHARQEIEIDIKMELFGSSAECSSDEEPSNTNMMLSDSGAVSSSDDEDSSELSSEALVRDDLYTDTMSLSTFNAGKDKLEKFLEKNDSNEPVSFVELYQVFDVGAKFDDFRERAKQGSATFMVSDDASSTQRMAAEAFNRFGPRMKSHFLKDSVGDQMAKAGLVMMFTHGSAMCDIMDIRYHIVKKLGDIGDVIEAKNEESYKAVAKMPAYSTVIKARRAEVEAMLDAGAERQLSLVR